MYPQIFGKYVLEREIASGGMAKVLLATLRGAVGFEKRLVVKQIRPELASDDAFVRRFVDEAKMTVDLSHPNIVPVYELGVEQGVYYIAMELCEGVTLAEILKDTGPLGPDEGAYVGIEICRALDYAHRRAAIVHRDVTPRNVMVDDEGAVRLIDFGIAAPAMLAGARQESFGSPGHMPPEQIDGGALTAASDVFAVGALLVEAWTGKPPFRRATPEACVQAMKEPLPDLTASDPALAPLVELIRDALALDASQRPDSAEALSRPLRDFVRSSDLGDLARKLGARVREVRRRGRISQPLLASTPARDGGARTPVGQHTPSAASSDAPGVDATRTFAARDELVEWTRRLPSTPPPPSVESDETSPTTASQRERRDSARATQLWRFAAVGLAGVVIAGVLTVRRGPEPAPAAPATSPSPVAPLPSPPPPLASSAPSPPAPAPTPPASAVVRVAPPAASVEPAAKARLNLTASHPATVSVAGRPRGGTPVLGLELPAGSVTVVFTNPVLDERVSASVTLAAGKTRSVHADFSAASPRIFVR
ncbi:MAG: serine/threonine protein kinase [Polyangiaceae bacterium]|nr:serine/threonine protein kinase [Polyangiaceae bacterium]